MSHIKSIDGDFNAGDAKFCILAARFNSFIVERLVEGAVDALVRHGISSENIEIIRVPGAYEMPISAQRIAQTGNYDSIIALGAVIRGSTPHFDYVAGECSKGLAQVSLAADMPIIFGVLTTDTIEQAVERAGTKAGNKGAEAAVTAIEMISLFNKLES
ncbi:6,7-dimethyl-8-ribityllumazine synthase [bacterium BMS3Bbin11]|nr:6,7-dimethyl-8-ribityllumazine synthase [bacterium BMS3Abin11]GBE46736.1 6,7-dimethyl-8-ribityllumazine synthase [bacterium BMS3Bbin11]GMT40883.1 MAG: 6,7-dimethyl-8-ribityllumazine synthase [bacterium]HDH09252.1 6,7-dimethyl-8-ribityllumazine synthase [Gammaproteobacteria bacterium]HDH15686.1 6,7-dimethyl-8-ribityllumazine synthase [Gammaproteobacteria bacterium]